MYENRAWARLFHFVSIFGIGQKSEVLGTGVFEAQDAGDVPAVVLVYQFAPEALCDLMKSHRGSGAASAGAACGVRYTGSSMAVRLPFVRDFLLLAAWLPSRSSVRRDTGE